MKRNIFFILILSSLALMAGLVTSCQDDEIDVPDDGILETSEYGIYQDLDRIFIYENVNHQVYLKKSGNDRTLRFLTNDGTKYIEVVLNGTSYDVGQTVSGQIKDEGFGVVTSKSISLMVLKVDSNNSTIWLRETEGSSATNIGIVTYWGV